MSQRSKSQEILPPEVLLGTRAESGTSREDERQYASMIGRIVEPVLVSLLDPRTKSITASPSFVLAYIDLVNQAENSVFLHTLTSTSELIEQYSKNNWNGFNSDIPDSLRNRGIIRLPSNTSLRTLLLEIDQHLEGITQNSFMGMYQSGVLSYEENQISPVGRFLINGVLVIAREIIAQAPNHHEIMRKLSRFERFETQGVISGSQRLHHNVKLMNGGGKPYILQLDAVRTDDNFKYLGAPLEKIPERGSECLKFLSSSHPWDWINFKMLGDTRALTGHNHLQKVRSVDEKQLFGQLAKLIYSLDSLYNIHSLNFPESAIFVYARPWRRLSICTEPLNSNFFVRFFDYLDNLLATNRIDPSLREPLTRVAILVAHEVTIRADKERENNKLSPIETLGLDVVSPIQAMENFMDLAAQTHRSESSIAVKNTSKWDKVLFEQRQKKKKRKS